MKTSVGQSKRTYGKHVLLNKLIGREVGIVSNNCPPYIVRQYTMLDLCAGDGIPSQASGVSSPAIMQKHLNTLKKFNVPSHLILVEKNGNTFDQLNENNFDAITFNCNAREIKELPKDVHKRSAAFIHADPNNVNDWPVTKELLSNMPEYTTLLATLGCNAGGLKRLPLAERRVWFERMDDLLKWMPERHDALLVVLRGDAAQWAYLLIGPKFWRKKYCINVTASFKRWESGVDMVYYRPNPNEFYRVRDKLFLTKGELGCQMTAEH